MIDLMDTNLLVPKAKPRKTYRDGYQLFLISHIESPETLLMEEGCADTVNLDDAVLWRQKKVKEKAIQFFEVLNGEKISARVLHVGFECLAAEETVTRKQIYGSLLDAGYKEGTASAQASQLISLFSNLRIIRAVKPYVYQINPSSLLYRKGLEAFGGKTCI